MTAHALIIEPEESTRDAAADLLEQKGFVVTETANWPEEIDLMISDSTACVFIEAKTFEEHHDLLEDLRKIDEALPVFVFGNHSRIQHTLSMMALASAVRAGGVQYAPDMPEAIENAIETLRATWKRARNWQGTAAAVADQMASARPAGPIQAVKVIHDPATGRLDAARVADYLGVSLAFLAEALGKKYSTVAKTPNAASLQAGLLDFKRIVEVLQHVFGDVESVRIWMNTPHPDLDYRTPKSVAQSGKVSVIRRMIDSTLSGNLS
jgi:FixJ family two-component response regulator